MNEPRILEPARGERPRILVVVGPTASGKSALAMRLAERIGGEIVSADSMQVYRHMDIGTAKASPADRARVPHHLIDVVDPDESFNVAQYKERADVALRDLQARGKHAIVVGGTGLYVKVLVHGIFPAPKVDPELRKRLAREAEVYGVEYLHAQLALVDPDAAGRIAATDLVRVIRALEVHEQTGIPLSEHQLAHSFHGRDYEARFIGIDYPREILYRRVEARVDRMIEMGLVAEVRSLIERGYGPALKPMQALGYKQVAEHVLGGASLEDAVRRTKRETKRYAKRQLTWFRNDPVEWVDADADLDPLAARSLAFFRREEEAR
jgi:tRNA dimethylallyltransferase